MTLKLGTIDEEKIKIGLTFEPRTQTHTYAASCSFAPQMNLNIFLAKFEVIQEFLFEVHSETQNYNGLFVKPRLILTQKHHAKSLQTIAKQ